MGINVFDLSPFMDLYNSETYVYTSYIRPCHRYLKQCFN